MTTTIFSFLFAFIFSFTQFLPAGSVSSNNSRIHCEKRDKCTCPLDPVTARYSDPADPSCDRYYLCHMGNAFLKYCDVRQAFHPEKKECLPRTSVAWELCPTAVDCTKNGYQADAKDCTMYYMCFYRQAYHFGCKAGHFYDKEQGECVQDAVKAVSCNKARSEVQPEWSYPVKHKRMDTDLMEDLPEEGGDEEKVEKGQKRESPNEKDETSLTMESELVQNLASSVN